MTENGTRKNIRRRIVGSVVVLVAGGLVFSASGTSFAGRPTITIDPMRITAPAPALTTEAKARQDALRADSERLAAEVNKPGLSAIELLERARQASLLGMSDVAQQYSRRTFDMGVAAAQEVARTSQDPGALLGAARQMQLLGSTEVAADLNDKVHTILDQKVAELLRTSTDIEVLLAAARQTYLMGHTSQSEELADKARDLIDNRPTGNAKSGNSSPGSTRPGSSPSRGSAPSGGSSSPAGARGDLPGTGSNGSTEKSSTSSGWTLPAGATEDSTNETKVAKAEPDSTDPATGQTVFTNYVNTRSVTYTDADGSRHKHTEYLNEDGSIDHTEDEVLEDSTDGPTDTSGYCADEGCGNNYELIPAAQVPPGCRVDGCPPVTDLNGGTGVEGQPGGTCDPQALYLDGCAAVARTLLTQPAIVRAQPCAADGCRRPDLTGEDQGPELPDPSVYAGNR